MNLPGLVSATSPAEVRVVRNTALAILGLVVLRLVAAAWTPLTFDEAYYWMWSKHLAGGYYDHPPGVAVVIRLGTLIAGFPAYWIPAFAGMTDGGRAPR